MSRGLILGPDGTPQKSGLQILVPRGHEDVIVGVCHVCGGKFGEGQEQAWQRHVGACARAHMDEILASRPSEKNKGGPFDPETWDPEVEAHMRKVGKKMLSEGRLEVLPHERTS